MKRITLILFLVMTSLSGFASHSSDNNQSIPLKAGSFSDPDYSIQRGLTPFLDVIYNASKSIIEIQYEGIGDAEVYIVNSHNQVEIEETISDWENYAWIECQLPSGTYTLIISSDVYYGEGNFHID